jgi:hypothetical protein
MNLTHESRLQQLELLQRTFSSFTPFLVVCMKYLGFGTSDIQKDIAQFLEYGPKDLMVQAQRSQAKSTITAIFAVWCLIHHPKWRVLIVSAGGTQANEISTLICKLILNMPILECLRPDQSAGDRTSVEHFDVHYSLKGIDKSPSVACVGITGNLQGKRADLLIADDVESAKNSRTAVMRELLLSLIKDFPSICTNGRIVFLGTPQSENSVYNTLPASGFKVRIWPGRYPTGEMLEAYGDALAPLILARIEANPFLQTGGGMRGDLGQPTDPDFLGEDILALKEQKQGLSYFMLQHMLYTKIADAMKCPLKSKDIIVMRLTDDLPLHVVRGMTAEYLRLYEYGGLKFHVSGPSYVSPEVAPRSGRFMYIDPAGEGGDDTAYAIVDQLNGRLYVRACASVRGGFRPDAIAALVKVAKKWRPDLIKIESNMGHGAVRMTLLPYLRADTSMSEGPVGKPLLCSVEDDFNTGQKELRIIETLEPVLGRGALIFDESVFEDDYSTTQHAPQEKRNLYTLMSQFIKITRDKGCLSKDDRIDVLASAVKHWVATLGIDSGKREEAKAQEAMDEWRKDPMGRNRYGKPPARTGQSVIRRR